MVANSRAKLSQQTLLPFQVSMHSNQWATLFQEKHLRPQKALSTISKIRKLVRVTQKILRRQLTMRFCLEPVKVRISLRLQHPLELTGGMYSTKAVKTETLKLIRQTRLSKRHFLTRPRLSKTVRSLMEPAE